MLMRPQNVCHLVVVSEFEDHGKLQFMSVFPGEKVQDHTQGLQNILEKLL